MAVITGAASGIGYGLAERAAKEGMKVVLADVEKDALVKAEKDIRALGVDTLAVKTDVSKAENVKALAEKTLDTFGAVHLLCNNAGVEAKFNVRESSIADWQWILGVNLWGVINGVHFFTPIMLKQGTECHIVNTASVVGLFTDLGGTPYVVSKHAIVAISEILYHEFEELNYNIGVSVLCPGSVKTKMFESSINRPVEPKNNADEKSGVSETKIQEHIRAMARLNQDVMTPEQVADIVFNAIREKKFYIMANSEYVKLFVKARMEDILQDRNPSIVEM